MFTTNKLLLAGSTALLFLALIFHIEKISALNNEHRTKKVQTLVNRFTGKNLDAIVEKADFYSSDDFLYPIIHAEEIRNEQMRLFRDKLLYTLPLNELLEELPQLGLYTKDVLKALILGLSLLYQKSLLHSYHEYFTHTITKHLITNRELILTQLKDPSDAHTDIYIPKTLVSWDQHLKIITRSHCFFKHSCETLINRITSWIQNHYLLNEKSQEVKGDKPIPLFSFVQATSLVEIPLGIPLATGSNALIAFLKRYNILPSTCDNIAMLFGRDTLISIIFLHQFTQQIIAEKLPPFLYQSHNQIDALLSDYDQKPQEVESALKKLIQNNMAIPLKLWLKEKYSTQAFWNGCYHAVFLLPILYKTLNAGYTMYKEINS